jgi:hypothetical protein
MEINSSSLAARETALNKANVGAELLSRATAKTEEGEQVKKASEPKAPEGPKSSKQGRIDLYA